MHRNDLPMDCFIEEFYYIEGVLLYGLLIVVGVCVVFRRDLRVHVSWWVVLVVVTEELTGA